MTEAARMSKEDVQRLVKKTKKYGCDPTAGCTNPTYAFAASMGHLRDIAQEVGRISVSVLFSSVCTAYLHCTFVDVCWC